MNAGTTSVENVGNSFSSGHFANSCNMWVRIKNMRCYLRIVLVLALAGCSAGQEWQTRDVTGILPDLQFELRNVKGETLTQKDIAGHVVALFFGYTSCPDICPMTMSKLRSAIDDLPEGLRDEVRVLFVSVDPQRDTPDRLEAYARGFGSRFMGLTSDLDTLKHLTRRYHATFSYAKPNENGFYTVSHPASVYVFDAKGNARLLVRQADSVEALVHDLRQLIE